MKMALVFVAGMMVSGLTLLATGWVSAQGDSDNFTLTQLLPDIERIYREALTTPLHEAKKSIYDEDIAQYYDHLLDECGLNEPVDEP